jgi:hypothetical protein
MESLETVYQPKHSNDITIDPLSVEPVEESKTKVLFFQDMHLCTLKQSRSHHQHSNSLFCVISRVQHSAVGRRAKYSVRYIMPQYTSYFQSRRTKTSTHPSKHSTPQHTSTEHPLYSFLKLCQSNASTKVQPQLLHRKKAQTSRPNSQRFPQGQQEVRGSKKQGMGLPTCRSYSE